MKSRDLIKKIEDAGYVLKEHGGNHDKYVKGENTIIVPRHKEINEMLAKSIIRRYGL